MNDSVLVRCNQKRVDTGHVMDRHGQVHFCKTVQLVWSRPGPEFDSWVPSSSDDYTDIDIVVWHNYTCHVFYRLAVASNLHDLVAHQIPLSNWIVRTCKQQGHRILLPAHAQDWHLNVLGAFGLHLLFAQATKISLPYHYMPIPTCSSEHSSELADYLTALRWKLDHTQSFLAFDLDF